ncbi:MAG TPA: hypothetical protein VE863_07895 [Pyrinomonadaceae bacterium]|jgi:hypothetical protein|nr:hypothetical protein [Pyrinomonadaceae bacterium]
MSSRLTVSFYIILCLEIGLVLTVLPWVPHGWLGLSDWGNNYFLLVASRKVGFGVQRFVASGWMRGAVSGLGILNLAMGLWEAINFRSTVRALDERPPNVKSSPQNQASSANVAQPVQTDPLSDYPRRNH